MIINNNNTNNYFFNNKFKLSDIQKSLIEKYKYYCSKYHINYNYNIEKMFKKENVEINTKYFQTIMSLNEQKILKNLISKCSFWKIIEIKNSLKFNNKNIIPITNNILFIISQIMSKSNIEIFSLNNLNLTENKTNEILYKILLSNKSIITFQILNCFFNFNENKENGFSILIQSIFNHKKITNLILINNDIENNYNSEILSKFLLNQNSKIKINNWEKTLHSNFYLNNIPKKYNFGFSELNLSQNKLTNFFIENILIILENDFYLRKLDLSYNLIEKSGCKNLIKLLKINRTLINVDLRYNPGYDKLLNMKLIIKLGNNLKYLRNLYFNKEIERKDYENILKNYADSKLFSEENEYNVMMEEIYDNNNFDYNNDNDYYFNEDNNNEENNSIDNYNVINNNNDNDNFNSNNFNDLKNYTFNNFNSENKNNNFDNNNNKINNLTENNNKYNLNNNDKYKNSKYLKKSKSNNLYILNKKLIKENIRLKNELMQIKKLNFNLLYKNHLKNNNKNKRNKLKSSNSYINYTSEFNITNSNTNSNTNVTCNNVKKEKNINQLINDLSDIIHEYKEKNEKK